MSLDWQRRYPYHRRQFRSSHKVCQFNNHNKPITHDFIYYPPNYLFCQFVLQILKRSSCSLITINRTSFPYLKATFKAIRLLELLKLKISKIHNLPSKGSPEFPIIKIVVEHFFQISISQALGIMQNIRFNLFRFKKWHLLSSLVASLS